MGGLPEHASVYRLPAWYPWRSEEDARSLGALQSQTFVLSFYRVLGAPRY